jgi:hypothetical protein
MCHQGSNTFGGLHVIGKGSGRCDSRVPKWPALRISLHPVSGTDMGPQVTPVATLPVLNSCTRVNILLFHEVGLWPHVAGCKLNVVVVSFHAVVVLVPLASQVNTPVKDVCQGQK